MNGGSCSSNPSTPVIQYPNLSTAAIVSTSHIQNNQSCTNINGCNNAMSPVQEVSGTTFKNNHKLPNRSMHGQHGLYNNISMEFYTATSAGTNRATAPKKTKKGFFRRLLCCCKHTLKD